MARILVGYEWRIIFLFKTDTLGHKNLTPVIFSHGSCHELDLRKVGKKTQKIKIQAVDIAFHNMQCRILISSKVLTDRQEC